MSRVDPESAGLNPVWRDSLAFVALSTYWQEGANSTEIEAARQLLVKDMKILEAIAPESGSSSNQVRVWPRIIMTQPQLLFSSPRLRDTNLIGRDHFMAPTMSDSEQ